MRLLGLQTPIIITLISAFRFEDCVFQTITAISVLSQYTLLIQEIETYPGNGNISECSVDKISEAERQAKQETLNIP